MVNDCLKICRAPDRQQIIDNLQEEASVIHAQANCWGHYT